MARLYALREITLHEHLTGIQYAPGYTDDFYDYTSH